ncbi:MAG: acyl carrier protein [Christensenellales bacterium]|jgi:acyl carrier protein
MVFEKIKKMIAEHLGVDESKIQPETNLVEDLKADSLDIVELIMDLEQEFELEIPDEELPKVVTVQDVVDYVEGKE